MANKGDFKVLDFMGKQVGTISIEILPCAKEGRPLTDKGGIVIRNPETDLLNKNVHFNIKINSIKGLNPFLFRSLKLKHSQMFRGLAVGIRF